MPSVSFRPVREEIAEPLRRTLTWLAGLRDARGRIVCPEHKLEHTGKSAYAIVLARELSALDPQRDGDFLRRLAREQAQRLVDNLVREGDSPCHTFRPGRHDPFNCSNAVIDGGACSDALATLVRDAGGELDADERERFQAASVLHARTYLRYAVLDKGIPAQRAWGLTGLAAAAQLARDPELERAAIEAVGVLEAIQNEDGSFPYHPLEWGAEHAGASDVSAFYQSRVTGFTCYALERLGRAPTDELFRGPLVRGLEFVLALAGPDGIKCGLVEAKPWYWGASYEVASHPFDVHALACGWQHFRKRAYAVAARRAFEAWVEHLRPDGRPSSHKGGPDRGRSYQCPLFWSAHAAWIARAARVLDEQWDGPADDALADEAIDLSVRWFPNAQLARLDDGRVAAWIRGARPAVNVHHGSPHGAGLLRVYDRRERTDVLARVRMSGVDEGEWSGRAGTSSWLRGWRSGRAALRFSAWLARVHARAGRKWDALRVPVDVFRRGVLAFGSPSVSSAFDLRPEVEVWADGVRLESVLAHRDGSPVAGSALSRTFTLDGDGLLVREELARAGNARGVSYRMPARARAIESSAGHASYRLGAGTTARPSARPT
ncbi:MAG: hypothetical protein ACKVWV_10950 [Planctomycetota bacterium]